MSVYSTATTISAETHTSTVTSYIPFTTSFTPPKSCSTKYRLDGPTLMAFDPAYGTDVETGVYCDPSAMTTWWQDGVTTGTGDLATRWSIGPFTCPVGWTTVASSTKDSSSTAMMCCPSDFYLVGGETGSIGGLCVSDVTSGMTLTYGSTSDDSDSFTMATTTLSSSSTVGAIDFWGWNVRYVVSSVTPSATSTFTSTSIESTATSTASTASTAQSTSPTSSNTANTSGSNTGSGLTVGAKTGIGVGVGVGAIGVIALIAALWIFGRRGKRTPSEDQPRDMASAEQSYGQQSSRSPRELHGSPMLPSELGASKSFSARRPMSPAELGSP